MKLLIDMNLSPRGLGLFADPGVDSIHWSDVGRPDAPDSEIMEYASSGGLVVLTQDLDFGAILAATRGPGPSVIQIRSDVLSPAGIGQQVIAALQQMASELDEGALVTIDPKRTRLHVLPLRTRG